MYRFSYAVTGLILTFVAVMCVVSIIRGDASLALSVLPFVLIAVALYAPAGITSRIVRFEVSPKGLNIRGDLYGRFIPRSDLRVAEAKIVSLRENPEYALRLRTNGVGAPEYSSGWHRLRNREKALLFLTNDSHLVYLPTTKDYSVLLSPAEPEAFLAALQSPA